MMPAWRCARPTGQVRVDACAVRKPASACAAATASCRRWNGARMMPAWRCARPTGQVRVDACAVRKPA
ncbi:hypothetical protein C7E14_23065, partial [Stenotrophomonas maltophilia]